MTLEGASPELALDGLVHDLNNVFTTILEAADLLGTDPTWSSMAALLERNVARGRRLLEQFHTQSGPQAAGEMLDVETLISSAIEFADDFLQASGTEVEFRQSVDPGLRIRGSWTGCERALFNLLINAGQAAPKGEVGIEARPSGDRVEILVVDSGPGVPPELLPRRIFEAGLSTKAGRPGLGLHIAESIIRQYAGTITASNRAGGGAEFRITLPSE
jgi:signal transduction histidine kinase